MTGSARVVLAGLIGLVSVQNKLFAQESAPVGIDVFAGGVFGMEKLHSDDDSGQKSGGIQGWQLGGSFREGRTQWLGWTGTYSRYTNEQAHFQEALGGVRVTSPFSFSGENAVRVFGHALTGYISGPANGAAALALGGGFDVLVFLRIQADYVRTSVVGQKKNSGRIFVGGVVPLCLTACRPEWRDGIPISHGRQ